MSLPPNLAGLHPEALQSFVNTARYIDLLVAQGRDLEEVLVEMEMEKSNLFWGSRSVLRHLSQAMMEAESIQRATQDRTVLRQVVGLSAEPSANEAPQARRAM